MNQKLRVTTPPMRGHATVRNALAALTGVLFLAASAPAALAQSWSSSAQNWSGGWGFSSPAERSLELQRAQAMLAARNAGKATSIVNNDYRQNYQENNVAAGASNNSDFVNGARNESTYAVGSLNTGSTNITVTGDGNTVSAVNSSESNGCIDGRMTRTTSSTPNLSASFGIDISVAATAEAIQCP